jgi:hypothetical protein
MASCSLAHSLTRHPLTLSLAYWPTHTVVCSLAHQPPAHSSTLSPTRSRTHSLIGSPTHPPAHPLTRPLTHPSTRSYECRLPEPSWLELSRLPGQERPGALQHNHSRGHRKLRGKGTGVLPERCHTMSEARAQVQSDHGVVHRRL